MDGGTIVGVVVLMVLLAVAFLVVAMGVSVLDGVRHQRLEDGWMHRHDPSPRRERDA